MDRGGRQGSPPLQFCLWWTRMCRSAVQLRSVAGGGEVLSLPVVAEYRNNVVSHRLVHATCDRMGVPAEPILEAAGIDSADTADPSGRVCEKQARVFWAEAIGQPGDRALGLHAAASIPRGSYGILDYLVGYSATIGEGSPRSARYVPTIITWLATTTEVDTATERLQLLGVSARGPRPSA